MRLISARSQTMPAGSWRPVLFVPEPATGERITVGLAVEAPGGEMHFRWLQNFDRLRRVFGEGAAKHLPFLIRHAEALIRDGRDPDTSHLHFGEQRPLWSRTGVPAVDELFHRFVPLARDFDGPPPPRLAVQNRRLRETVYQKLQASSDPRAAALVPQNPMLRFPAEPGRYLEVPIQGPDRFATLVSAHARKPGTIDRNIYPAVAQLSAAAKLHKIHNVAVFLLRPDENQFSAEEYEAIDEHVHQTLFVLRNEGITVTAEISPDLVTDAVLEWGVSN